MNTIRRPDMDKTTAWLDEMLGHPSMGKHMFEEGFDAD